MSRWKHGENPYEESIGAVFDLGNNRELHGRIVLDQESLSYASTTRIFENKLFSIPGGSDLHGASEKGRVSLLSCHGGGGLFVYDDGQHPVVQDGGSTSVNLRSEYAVFGKEHLNRADAVIRSMRFVFDDFHAMLDDPQSRDAFGRILDPDPRLIEAIEKYKGSGNPSFGEHGRPWVFYCNGKYQVLSTVETVLGSVSAQRIFHVTMSGGTNASDVRYMNVEFGDEPVTLEHAVQKMNTIRQFFAWIVGYAPKWKNVLVFKGEKDAGFDVFTSNFGGTTSELGTLAGVHTGQTLISPSWQPDHFMKVMTNWLARNSDRARPNRMFFASMRGMFTTVMDDTMCAAANMFDQLPATDRPGRSMNAKMLDVARHRYQKVIRPRLRPDFELPRMEQVVESAINCRHHITHGFTKGKTHGVNYSDPEVVVFLSDALRFVYGVSELLDCEWDMERWLPLLFKRNHPFGRFIESYDERLPL